MVSSRGVGHVPSEGREFVALRQQGAQQLLGAIEGRPTRE